MFFPSRFSPKFCVCALQEHESFLQNVGQPNLNWWGLCRFSILLSLCIVESLRSSRGSWQLRLGSYLMVVGPKQLRHDNIHFSAFLQCLYHCPQRDYSTLRLQKHQQADCSAVQKWTCFLLQTQHLPVSVCPDVLVSAWKCIILCSQLRLWFLKELTDLVTSFGTGNVKLDSELCKALGSCSIFRGFWTCSLLDQGEMPFWWGAVAYRFELVGW